MADGYEERQPESGEFYTPEPHPYLHDPLLHITNVPLHATDENLAIALATCGPFRPRINRDTPGPTLSGVIEFKELEKAEKALATLQGRPIPGVTPAANLVLSPYPPTNPPTPLPPPSATPRMVKHLPVHYTDSQLYDAFRPFGSLASVRVHALGADNGIVEFWNEDEAKTAEEAMHCSEIEGQTIAVQLYQPRRVSSEFSPNAAPFVPSGSVFPYPNQYSPPRGPPSAYSPRSISNSLPFVHGPGQQVQLAPMSGPGSNSHSGLIDPCNLFCKNLDPEIDSNALFSHFRKFGQIVSARVMRNEAGDSRGFGFVSYQTPDQANAALHAMNGLQLGSKQIIVRLHEPKQLRQEKLAQRFGGHNGHPRGSSGATSPTASEGGESFAGWGGSPRHYPSNLGSPGGSSYERPDRGRRGSGSYYNAALSGTLNLPMRYDDLSTLSPVVRQEVLTGELIRRVKQTNLAAPEDVDSIVDSLVHLSLSEVVQVLDDPKRLSDQVSHLTRTLHPDASRSESTSQDSRLLNPDQLNATASAPEHPSTPISGHASLSTPPRTSSPSGSVPPTSERERIFHAICKLESTRQDELTELLMSLPKRERAMCLFNMEVLRAKLVDAKLVLESSDAEEEAANAAAAASSAQQVPVTPQPKKTASLGADGSPQTPDLSSRGPSATSSPMPVTPSSTATASGAAAQFTSVAALAKLPAAEIVRLASNARDSSQLPVPKADPLVVQTTDEFIDGLLSKTVQQQKQAVGDKLFKVVKSFGIKAAPKVTIALLDQEDLRALAHLMNSYPAVLKDKAMAISTK